jgi:hypothetical protein
MIIGERKDKIRRRKKRRMKNMQHIDFQNPFGN